MKAYMLPSFKNVNIKLGRYLRTLVVLFFWTTQLLFPGLMSGALELTALDSSSRRSNTTPFWPPWAPTQIAYTYIDIYM